MKIKIMLLSLFVIGFSQASEMIRNKYEIILNNEEHFEGDGHEHGMDINDIHNGLKNQDKLILESKNNLFKECIKRSNNLINILDKLKELPEEDRVVYLYKSNYWDGLSEEYQNKTLLILNKIGKISDEQYIIIKGKIASMFKEECIAIKNN